MGTETYAKRPLSAVERLVIHHTAGANRDFSALEIARYHVEHNGWPGIGYHFVVHPDGSIDYVGDMATIRYHVGLLNATSVGICLAGDFTAEWPTDAALHATCRLVQALRAFWPDIPVVGHCDIWLETGRGPTSCPGETWDEWAQEVTA